MVKSFPKQPVPEQHPLTREAHEALRARLRHLMKERQEAQERLNTAREMGDLSENGAYKYAKFELGNIGRELRDIHHQLDNSVVVEVKSHYAKVEFGARVTVLFGGKEVMYSIVSKFESNPLEKRISMESPLGVAIAGQAPGFKTQVKTPKGDVELEILRIE